jgi:hypothetical protein
MTKEAIANHHQQQQQQQQHKKQNILSQQLTKKKKAPKGETIYWYAAGIWRIIHSYDHGI